MIAYNRTWLDAILIKNQSKRWLEQQHLTAAQWQAIQEQYPSGFYSPNLFVRIGLALFCGILILAAAGLLFILTEPERGEGFGVLFLFISIVCFTVLETWIIPRAQHYGSGIDDMLLYAGAFTLSSAIGLFLPENSHPAVYYLIAMVVGVFATLRYTDRLAAAGAFVAGYIAVFHIFEAIMPTSAVLIPVAWVVYSGVVYVWVTIRRKQYSNRYWEGTLDFLAIMALAGFYFGGNYWVVRESFKVTAELGYVPGAWLFWVFTVVVPVVYLYAGWKQKNRILLDLGFAAVAASLLTFRYYYAVMPLAWAATLGGAVLLAMAWWTIHRLKNNALPGYTYEDHGEKNIMQEAEEQLIEQSLGSQAPPASRGENMGGGQFGGGGGGGTF